MSDSTKTLADDPADVAPGSDICSDWSGTDVGGIIGSEGLEDTPRKAAQEETDQEHGQGCCEVDDEDESRKRHERRHEGLLVPESLHQPSTEQDPDHLADRWADDESRLPRCRDLADVVDRSFGTLVLAAKDRVGQEAGDEDEVEAFHDAGARQDDCLEDGRPECLHTSQE